MTTLSPAAVRAVMLAAQGLTQPPVTHATKADVLTIIRQMQVLQIDTIHVVARSPYLVLWSRLGDYQPRWLEELLAEGKLFEYWSHAACFLPIEDYRYYRRLMLEWHNPQQFNSYTRKWREDNRMLTDAIMSHVQTHGTTRSSDFKRTDGEKGAWWNWKGEKMALEVMFNIGDLMIAKRHNFQRVYDLRERVLPTWDDSQAPTLEEVHRFFVLQTVKALGVVKPAWVADYFRMSKVDALKMVKQLVAEGALQTVEVETWNTHGLVHPDNAALLAQAAAGQLPKSITTLLSPFDPIVWDRERASELFKFDYKIECYTPEPKRIYGYFTLPILYNNALIGRLDPKAHRKEKLFEVKALHLEPDVEVTDELVREVKAAIQRCADWHQTPNVIVRRSNPPELAQALNF